MSLLEDVFLQDEAGEALELERIIEGDEYDERPRPSSPDSNDNSEKEDEAEEDKRRVEPESAKQKRVVKNPRIILNPARLTGPRGIQVLPEHFKDFKFKGKGHEKEDLDLVLKKLKHWAYRLFPKFEFGDCLKKIETLGNKRPVMVLLAKIRSDQFMSEETVVQRDSTDDEAAPEPVQEEDEFDKLLQQQIELARATPAPESTRKPAYSTPILDKVKIMPKATSSPSINEEQRERMLRNRQLAEERRLSRLKPNAPETNTSLHDPINVSEDSEAITNEEKIVSLTEITVEESSIADNIDEDDTPKVKNNRLNVIDSSDEDDTLVINESFTVDIHDSHRDDRNEEIHADVRNKNTDKEHIEEISASNDVAMINLADENKDNSNNYDKIKLHNPDKIEVNSDVDSIENVKRIATRDINLDSIECNNVNDSSERSIEVLKSHVTDNNPKDDKNEAEDEHTKGARQDFEDIENLGVEKEKTSENYVEDMDLDFSDDF